MKLYDDLLAAVYESCDDETKEYIDELQDEGMTLGSAIEEVAGDLL